MNPQGAATGLTVREVAKLMRVSKDKVRAWIRTGQLGAINRATQLCGKPRFIVLPHHLADFERRRLCGPVSNPARRKRKPSGTDYYPD